jgi:hypothetical protein
LFYHLGDAARLKTNPIVARLFEGSATLADSNNGADERLTVAVRNAIVAVAKRLQAADCQRGLKRRAQRHFQIVVRCDAGGEPQKVVASDLGISVRHLRRERLSAQTRIVEVLWAEANSPVSVSLDVALLELAICRQLWEAGDSKASSDNLIAIASNASSIRHRIRAIVDLTDVLIQQGQVSAVQKIVSHASATIANSPIGSADREICSSWIDLAQSRIEFASGNQQAGQALERAAISVMAAAGAGRDILEREVLARSLLARAKRRNVWGDFEGSRRDLSAIEGISAETFPLPPSFVVEHLTTVGDVALAVYGYDVNGFTSLRKALSLAQQHGLGRRAVIAGRTLADMQYLLGERRAAEQLTAKCVEAAVALGMSDMIIEVALDAAELATLRRDWQGAQPYLDLASAQSPAGTSAIRLQVVEADCLLLAGKAALALRHAQSANEAAAAIDNQRLRGTALRTIVEAQFALNRVQVVETLYEMLATLQAHGSKGSLMLGLAVSARVSEEPRFRDSVAKLQI